MPETSTQSPGGRLGRWWRARRSPLPGPYRTRTVRIGGLRLRIVDHQDSHAVEGLRHELAGDCYGVERIPLSPRDVVIDIGAHVGTFSIYLAKRYPALRILAYEPIPENFACLQANLEQNGVTNVRAHNLAVTGDGRTLEMVAHTSNTGGATGSLRDLERADHSHYKVDSVTLDDIFRDHDIDRCRLLKIDCEGSEYEILLHTPLLPRIDYLSAEFHINGHLESLGYSIEELVRHCRSALPSDRVRYTSCRMAE